ncbi:hypothetical protein PHYPSEUDO_006599 [Phytophthora pseudosyringae]|uniref:Elicitin n=1 Tax=Phytophthora pseudosyringae TaxID=221518 RepID=A0A8T1VI55_9STRA|nr:hypothetical protein PHYPSEUDO_006599 [Phytophthora pseudosyringae]
MMSFVHTTLNLFLLALCVTWTNAEDPPRAIFEPSPIATATPNSPTFALVNNTACNSEAIATIYDLYERNTMVFQTCVSETKYQIFPFDGTFPTTEQIASMGRSLACRAIFSSALLAGVPECDISGFPLRAAAETQLKITVDMRNYPMAPAVVPSTERFVDMMYWRRNANNAEAAGLPCDSESKLYSEFASNLYTMTTDGLVRLTTGMKVEYRPDVDTPFSQEMIMALPELPILRGSGSIDSSLGSASAATSDDIIVVENPGAEPGIPPAEAESSGAMSWSTPRTAIFSALVISTLV